MCPEVNSNGAGSMLEPVFAPSSSVIVIPCCLGPHQMVRFTRPALLPLLTAAATVSSVCGFFGGAPSHNPPESDQGVREPAPNGVHAAAEYIPTCKPDQTISLTQT